MYPAPAGAEPTLSAWPCAAENSMLRTSAPDCEMTIILLRYMSRCRAGVWYIMVADQYFTTHKYYTTEEQCDEIYQTSVAYGLLSLTLTNWKEQIDNQFQDAKVIAKSAQNLLHFVTFL